MNTSLYVTGPAIFNNDVSILGTLTCNTMDIITTEIIIGDTTLDSKLFVSGSSMFQNATTCLSSLNVIGATTHSGATTALSTLNISGITTLNNATTCIGKLSIAGNVNQNINDNTALIMDAGGNGRLGFLKQGGYQPKISTISGSSIIFTSLTGGNLTQTITNTTTFQDLMALSSNGTLSVSGNTNILSGFNVSGNTTLNNLVTCVSSLNVSGNAIFNNQVTCLSSLNVAGNLTVAGTTTEVNMIIQSNETVVSSLNVSGTSTFNNQVTCLSSLNVSGTSNMGPLYINNLIGTQNTFLNIGLNSSGDAYYRVNYNTAGSRMHMFGDSTGNNYMSITPNSVTIQGSTTINSTLNCVGNIYAPNIPSQAAFNVIISTPCIIGSKTYYRYDLDLTKYTTYITIAPTTQTRKFKFMSWLTSGAHNSGLYSLNYDIDYSFINYTGLGTLAAYNGLNALAYGYPYQNYNLNQITPNGLFIWKYTFNYITIFASVQNTNLQCLIIDYLN